MRTDVESVAAIRDAVGPAVELMVDANGAYDASSAIRVGRGLEPLDVTWLEEPVPADDLEGYRRVHAMTSTPLAAGESHFGVIGFRSLIADGLIDYVQPDLGRCGGITAARQIYSLTYAGNKHSSTCSSTIPRASSSSTDTRSLKTACCPCRKARASVSSSTTSCSTA